MSLASAGGTYMKKWYRWIIYPVLSICLGVVLLDGAIALVARSKWFNEQIDAAVEKSIAREFSIARIGANLSGVFIEDLQIAEQGGFEKGTFAQIKRAQLRISLLHLLYGHVKIKGLVFSDVDVNLLKRADGTANWDDWATGSTTEVQTEPQEEEASAPFNITATHVRIERLSVAFTDQQIPRTLEISDVNLELSNFSLGEEFALSFWANFHHRESGFEREIPLLLHAKVNLSQLDWEQAYATVQMLKASYQKSSVILEGTVKNFISPQADFKLTMHKLSSGLFEGVASLPAFDLNKATGVFNLSWDSSGRTLAIQKATLQAPGLDISAHGKLTSEKEMHYQFDTQLEAALGEAGRWFTALADPYRLVGKLQTQATFTQDKITAQIALENVGGFIEQVGQLSNITGNLSGWEALNFKSGKLDAKLDGKFEASPLTVSLAATQTPQRIKMNLEASAKELIWNMPAASANGSSAGETETVKTSSGVWPLPPMDLKVKMNVDKLDVPYFYGTHIAFDTDLQSFTPDLKQTQGAIHLRTEDGKIQDIYKLTNANPLTKILFMSLNVTGKVFNSLNVFGVLKSLGGGLVSMVSGGSSQPQETEVKVQTVLGPDGEPIEVPVVQTAQEISGEMAYDKFDTLVNFNDGKATVKDGTFVSTMMSLRLDGTTDFNTGVVDLTVHAAPGRHEVDGMMPLTLKIGGTIDEPKGNMQLIGSVASLVTQTVTNNVVSRNVTKGVKGLFGLFKKKEEAAAEPTENSVDETPTKTIDAAQ